jgi:predicted CoA-substrate-specific enzyme activase
MQVLTLQEGIMMQEYWKWPESRWASHEIDRKKAKRITAGVDIGTTSSQAVVFCDGELCSFANIMTGGDFRTAADAVMEQAIGACGMRLEDVHGIVATGFGAGSAAYASRRLDEIRCVAEGARFMFGPSVTTVVDMGGQSTRAIRLYDWNRVRDFTFNDKCATGMGRSIELLADILQIPLTEIGDRSLDVEKEPEPVSTTCYAFAVPETVNLFRSGYKEASYSENEVLASFIFAVAWRILGVIGKLQPLDPGDFKVYGELAFTGGLAKNSGVTKRIERELNTSALTGGCDPQLAGAIGAALLA